MKFPLIVPHLRSIKFAPFALIALFVLTNFTGVFIGKALAPSVNAATEVFTIPADIPTSGDKNLDWIIFRTGEREGVDPRFIHAVIWQESKYKPQAVSHAGAQGLMQLMPATAQRFGCKDVYDQAANIQAGTKYLAWLLKRFNGDVTLALAGYNAGEGSVDKYKGIPPYNETQNYVKKIVSRYGKTYHPVLPPEDAKVAFDLVPQDGQFNTVPSEANSVASEANTVATE
jgi:soluble lytic murein transglycosylase-like protein